MGSDGAVTYVSEPLPTSSDEQSPEQEEVDVRGPPTAEESEETDNSDKRYIRHCLLEFFCAQNDFSERPLFGRFSTAALALSG